MYYSHVDQGPNTFDGPAWLANRPACMEFWPFQFNSPIIFVVTDRLSIFAHSLSFCFNKYMYTQVPMYLSLPVLDSMMEVYMFTYHKCCCKTIYDFDFCNYKKFKGYHTSTMIYFCIHLSLHDGWACISPAWQWRLDTKVNPWIIVITLLLYTRCYTLSTHIYLILNHYYYFREEKNWVCSKCFYFSCFKAIALTSLGNAGENNNRIT